MLKNSLTNLLVSGLIQGKNSRVLARDLRKTFDTSKSNAERLMRTELARVQTEAQKQSFERNGIEKYTFSTLSGCCDLCEEIAKRDIGYGPGVYLVKDMQPGENAAPIHPRCRCAAIEYTKDMREALDRMLDSENGGTTAEWNKLKAKTTPLRSSGKAGDTDGYTTIDAVQRFDFNDGKAIQKEVSAFFEKYAYAGEEHAVVISPNGNLYRLTGTSGNVNTAIIGEDALRGSIGMHNHPVWSGFDRDDAFSKDDVSFTVEHKTGVEYLTSGNKRWSFGYTGKLSADEIVEAYEKALLDAQSIAFESGNVLEFAQEAAMQILAQRLEGFTFDENL